MCLSNQGKWFGNRTNLIQVQPQSESLRLNSGCSFTLAQEKIRYNFMAQEPQKSHTSKLARAKLLSMASNRVVTNKKTKDHYFHSRFNSYSVYRNVSLSFPARKH